jgi:hypothetical protein
MTPECISYMAAQRSVEHVAGNAFPNAPIQVTGDVPISLARLVTFRQWPSTDLRRLADRIEPSPRHHASVLTTSE